ncbi:hypothetical protein M8C21_018174, partial [Ambrosia artemisiifolia]
SRFVEDDTDNRFKSPIYRRLPGKRRKNDSKQGVHKSDRESSRVEKTQIGLSRITLLSDLRMFFFGCKLPEVYKAYRTLIKVVSPRYLQPHLCLVQIVILQEQKRELESRDNRLLLRTSSPKVDLVLIILSNLRNQEPPAHSVIEMPPLSPIIIKIWHGSALLLKVTVQSRGRKEIEVGDIISKIEIDKATLEFALLQEFCKLIFEPVTKTLACTLIVAAKVHLLECPWKGTLLQKPWTLIFTFMFLTTDDTLIPLETMDMPKGVEPFIEKAFYVGGGY